MLDKYQRNEWKYDEAEREDAKAIMTAAWISIFLSFLLAAYCFVKYHT